MKLTDVRIAAFASSSCPKLPTLDGIELPKMFIPWKIGPDSKSGVPQGTGGSNPSLSATFLKG